MELNLVKVKAGEIFSRPAEQEKKDSRLLSLCKLYNIEELCQYIENLILNFED